VALPYLSHQLNAAALLTGTNFAVEKATNTGYILNHIDYLLNYTWKSV